MSTPKERHYWSQLRAVLTAGQWRSSFPAKAPNGTPLPWSELFRKFNKHCKGFRHVAEVASQTQILGSLLATDVDDEDVIGNTIHPPLDVGREGMLVRDRVEEGLAGYELLKGLEPSNSLNFALVYYAYALDKPLECVEHLSRVPDLLMIQSHILSPSPSDTGAGSFVTLVDSSLPEIHDGRGWAMAETFRSICLQGMSHERLYPSEPRRALQAYLFALPLFRIITSEFTLTSSTQATGKLDFTPFFQLREMWRWVERLLWRAVVLSSRLCEVHQDESTGATESLWQWFDHYAACSVAWPSYFRTAHRSAINSIYLHAFVLRYRVLSESPLYVSKTPPWLHQARSLIQDYRAILTSSTKFPRAGERNVKVEDFVDLCVAIWEASGGIGEYAGWVIEILWWATRYTFNSPRVYRHMTRLFHLAGDTVLAIRTLKLYVQVVSKAYQASKEGLHAEVDSDNHWVETLVFGVRMICRHAAALDDPESIDGVRYAGTLIGKARARLYGETKVLVASIDQAEGVWHSVMALKEEDPYTRPERLRTAHHCLIRSVSVQPTSSGYYHLALSFARPGPSRDLQKAIESAGLALEADPKELRYWHLLGLLLTAQQKWKEAAEILERGAELDREVSGELEEEDADDGGGDEEDREHEKFDSSSIPSPTRTPRARSIPAYKSAYVLGETGAIIPPASRLLRSMLEKNSPSKRDIYEHGLQLRMTQAALNEVVEGPEGAEEKWVEVFSWIAEKKGVMHSSEHSHRPSMESAVPPSMMDKTFATSQTQVPISANGTETESLPPPPVPQQSQLIVAPIPITVSPATPTSEDVVPPPEVLSEKAGDRDKEKEKPKINGLLVKRSISIDRGDTSKSKKEKMQQMLKDQVHKSRAGITAVSKKIGHGVAKQHHRHMRRTNSSPADFHEVIRSASFQASSIHSRRRLGSFLQLSDRSSTGSPPPPPPPPLPPPQMSLQEAKPNNRQARESRLLSNLWLMSAATFRRLGKIDQAKGAIQEAEVRDEGNPNVWVQLGLHYFTLGHRQHAIDALQKALIINTDDISATIHLSRIYLATPPPKSPHYQHQRNPSAPSSPVNVTTNGGPSSPTPGPVPSVVSSKHTDESDRSDIDLAAGLLSHLTKGKGWDVPEAWYFLAKAYSVQGRKEKERETLEVALVLSEGRGVREVQGALGWCI